MAIGLNRGLQKNPSSTNDSRNTNDSRDLRSNHQVSHKTSSTQQSKPRQPSYSTHNQGLIETCSEQLNTIEQQIYIKPHQLNQSHNEQPHNRKFDETINGLLRTLSKEDEKLLDIRGQLSQDNYITDYSDDELALNQ